MGELRVRTVAVRFGVAILFVVCAIAWASADSAAATKPFPSSLTWKLEPGGLSMALPDGSTVGDSALFELNQPPDAVVINGNTNQVTRLPTPDGCSTAGVNRTQIAYQCFVTGDPEATYLYTPAAGSTVAVNSQPIQQECSKLDAARCSIIAVGTDWIEWDITYGCQGGEHCGEALYFQSIATGQITPVPDDGDGDTWDDPDMSGLVHSLCSPLQAPPQADGPGISGFVPSIQFFGRYALIYTEPPVENGFPTPSTELAECGSNFHVVLQPSIDTSGAIGGDDYIVWQQNQGRIISYIDLRNRHRGTWTAPSYIGDIQNLTIAGQRLFVQGTPGGIWSATLPRALRTYPDSRLVASSARCAFLNATRPLAS